MAMYGDPSFADLLPAYHCNNYMLTGRQAHQSPSIWKGILTHLIAMFITVGLCSGGYFYYQNIYIPQHQEEQTNSLPNIKADVVEIKSPVPSNDQICSETINNQILKLKEELTTIHSWRSTVNNLITQMQWQQDMKITSAIEESLEIYQADDIGFMDYAATYAGGVIVGISRDTLPYPTHRPLSLFKVVNVDVLSNPEELIRPCVLPGHCFAFREDSGSIRIKLGKPINIAGVTLSHASKLLLDMEGMSSAPREFEVHAFTNSDDETGTFLGRFLYDRMGKQHQTFTIRESLSKNQIFQEVALTILNNYGKEDFTCVYRFRVHKSDHENEHGQQSKSGKVKKKNKCC